MPNEDVEKAVVSRVEKWQDYNTGIHGLVDIKLRNNVQMTLEFDDDTATELNIKRQTFEAQQSSKIWLITTAYNRPKHFKRFLNSVKELTNKGETNFGVCVGVFYDKENEKTLEEEELLAFKEAFPKVNVEILRNPLPFEKAPTLQKCLHSNSISENDIVFMVDVDVTFPPTIFNTVRRYVDQGKRAFNPIVWYREADEGGNDYGKYYVGFAWGGIGIVALYKSDVMKFNGYDIVNFKSQHGFEDSDFFFKIKYVGLQIVRLPIREMEHWPHSRNTWEQKAERNVNDLCPQY